MAIEGTRIGPFIGGLNIASDPTSIGDTDLAVCDNMELDLDGSLVSRPPIVNLSTSLPSGSMNLIGYYIDASGTAYLIAHNNSNTYYYLGGSWTQICDFPCEAVAQYKDKLWMPAPVGSSKVGGSWSPSAGFATVSAMPKGASIVAHKERLWIAQGPKATSDGARIYYCDVGDPTKWPGNFLNVNDGDGQNVVALFLYYNDLLIFKTRSTHRFSYSASPSTGVVSKVSETVGAATADSVVAYENSLFVVFSDRVYEISNYNFTQINNKVPLRSTVIGSFNYPVSISVWADRLIVNYFGTTYVYGIKTSTWSTWSRTNYIGKVLPLPITYLSQRPDAYIASALNDRALYSISETLTLDRKENISCTIVTKNYDYQSAHTFKALKWWGIDTILMGTVEATVTPIVHSVSPTWKEVGTKTWAELGAWGRLLDKPIDVTDSIAAYGVTGTRKFIKMLKALRFRQVNFKLKFSVDGTPSTAPVKLFSLTTFVGIKERVHKKIS